ncbi:MAG: RidA family protein [Betaproteobacteria bacterium]|nr:RidA family protein [Betaproteobacteria bacterium]MDE2048414.1 RidA family protein [Betaproteobacteria bacterium]
MEFLQPPDWAAPKGYANGVAVDCTAGTRLVFIGGQIGWNAQQQFTSDDFVAQAEQALRNTVAVLAAAGGRPEHIARLTWYVTDRDEYVAGLRALGAAYRAVMGRHFPAMTCVQVARLIEHRAKVEIEATAVITR